MTDIDSWINSVGPGWRPLVRGVDANLRAVDPDYSIHQIKEKFGGLRYYYGASNLTEEMEQLVREAEALSHKICEDCGAPGKECTPTGFWVLTLCPLDQKKREDDCGVGKQASDG